MRTTIELFNVLYPVWRLLVFGFLRWFRSRRWLHAELEATRQQLERARSALQYDGDLEEQLREVRSQRDRLVCRLAREKDAREVLERQRSSLLDQLDAVTWKSRAEAAHAKAAVQAIQVGPRV